jgi:hypothetical protein
MELTGNLPLNVSFLKLEAPSVTEDASHSALSVVGSGYYVSMEGCLRISIKYPGLPQLYNGSCIDPQP